jgi:hypothetical protein
MIGFFELDDPLGNVIFGSGIELEPHPRRMTAE